MAAEEAADPIGAPWSLPSSRRRRAGEGRSGGPHTEPLVGNGGPLPDSDDLAGMTRPSPRPHPQESFREPCPQLAGGVVVPVNPLYKSGELAFVLADADAKVFFAWDGVAEEAEKGAADAALVEEFWARLP